VICEGVRQIGHRHNFHKPEEEEEEERRGGGEEGGGGGEGHRRRSRGLVEGVTVCSGGCKTCGYFGVPPAALLVV